jgi:ribose transport system permease protein
MMNCLADLHLEQLNLKRKETNMPELTLQKKRSLGYYLSVYNLPLILAATFFIFSLLLPHTFPTAFNIRSILNYQSVVILLALAVMVPIASGHFDLSVGYNVGLMHILAVGLQVKTGVPWWFVIIILPFLGAIIGIINGLLVTRIGMDSFIATLGIGTVLYALAFWYTDGRQVIGILPDAFLAINSNLFGGVPSTALITLFIAIVMWIVLEYLPMGRYFYFLGANQKAADLSGISSRKWLVIAFICSGVLTAIAGILLAAILRVGQISVGPDYLMNSFAGALLGSVALHPGRVNVWGTICAVLLMALAVSGLQQMGAQYFVEPLFNGGMLIVAVSLATITSRRRSTKIIDKKNKAIKERSNSDEN